MTEDILCPYCFYDGAIEEWQKRGHGRGLSKYCDICGWYEYEPAGGYDDPKHPPIMEKPTQEIITEARKIVPMLKIAQTTNNDYVDNALQDFIVDDIPDMIREKKNFERFFVRIILGNNE